MVRGQPALPNNGSWSVVKMAAPGNTADPQEATSADVSRGTPLFIENSWLPPSGNEMNVSGPAGPYRFADPVDLFAAQARFDYGFMQNTGSQAFLFRRPVIAIGSNELSSDLKPAFADPFAMLTSKGVFPPIANVIEFPTANYKFLIQSGTGKLRLNTPVNLNNLRVPLVVAQDGTNQIAIEYDQSDLRINLNYDDWNVELDNFFIWTSLLGISKFSGTRFSLRAGTTRQAKLVNIQSLLKPEIQDALNFLPGMGRPNYVDDIDLGMTNAKREVKFRAGWEKGIKISTKFKLKLKGNTGIDPVHEPEKGLEQFFVTSAGGELQGKFPIFSVGIADIFIVLGFELEMAYKTQAFKSSVIADSSSHKPQASVELEITAYVGIGVGSDLGIFHATAFVAVGIIFIWEAIEGKVKLGGLAKVEIEVDLKVISINISGELKGIVYKEGGENYCDASGSVALNVSIFLVINIKESYAYKVKNKLDSFGDVLPF
jgi:hypothetical protein